ncbi:MAG: hypothetical protein PF795_12120 [Kiritimatiellae bacterium]|nr:hypothetical protein [Kiritimatiellia bacterium]
MTFLKRLLSALLLLSPTLLLAHPSHPGPEAHGDLTHLIVGLVIALPALIGFILWLRHHTPAVEKRSSK